MWDGETFDTKMFILESETTVMHWLLRENAALVKMVKRGDSKQDCLNFVNENW